jgi:protein TonB
LKRVPKIVAGLSATLRLCRWPAAALLITGLHALALFALVSWAEDDLGTTSFIAVNFAPLPEAAPQLEAVAADAVEPQPVAAAQMHVEPAPVAQAEVELPSPPRHTSEEVAEPRTIEPRKDSEKRSEASFPMPRIPEPTEEARPSTVTAAPNPGRATSALIARATWEKTLVSHLDRHKRYPEGSRRIEGVVTVEFTMDRSGHLLTSRIAESSGSPILDAEAIGLLRRSEPLPAPPATVPDAALFRRLPVNFKVH